MLHFKYVQRVGLLLFFFGSLIGSVALGNSILPLPMMPSKAKQKKIDALRDEQRKSLRNELDRGLSNVQVLNKSIVQDARYLKYFTQTWFAMLLKKSQIMYKKALSIQVASEAIDKKRDNEKILVNAIDSDQWFKQLQLRAKIERSIVVSLLARQAVAKREKQELEILKKEIIFKEKISDLERAIAQKELQLECECLRVKGYAYQLLKLSKTEELACAVPLANPLNEV